MDPINPSWLLEYSPQMAQMTQKFGSHQNPCDIEIPEK